ADQLHHLVVSSLEERGAFPATFDEKLTLWKKLVARGITSETDRMFEEMLKDATPEQKVKLRELAIPDFESPRIWEPQLKAELLEDRVRATDVFKTLVEEREQTPADRKATFEGLLKLDLLNDAPKDYFFGEVIEHISQAIRSSESES